MDIIHDILNTLKPTEDNIQQLICNQIKHLGYVDVSDYNMPIDEYVVQDAHKDKWNRTWLSLYHLASNQSHEYKCNTTWFEKNPCVNGDLVRVAFNTREKSKLVGEKPDGKKIFQKTGEYENIVECYEVLTK